ncbi:MAG: hypothetical protein ACI4VH_07610 [Clostridia bacterium]
MEELKENEMMFDDRELEEFIDEPIEIDEEFQKQVTKEIDEYLKENPIQYED